MIFDHFPVHFEWDDLSFRTNYPFKFNHVVLQVEHFSQLVRHSWCYEVPLLEGDDMNRLSHKLKHLKHAVINWEKDMKKRQGLELFTIEH